MNEFNNQVNGGNNQFNSQVNNQTENQITSEIQNENRKSFKLVIAIIALVVALSGGTLAYFAFSASNNAISGEAGVVDLTLTVTKVLPDADSTVDDILVINFGELADSLNDKCTDSDGEFALCQLYKVNLANSSAGVGTNVKGSIAFDNENVPNLSWVYLGTSYSDTTTYTSTMLGDTFNTASSTFTNFITNYNLLSGTNVDFYILMWVNETEEEQTDQGTYGGTIRFEDSQGKGVTSTFTA